MKQTDGLTRVCGLIGHPVEHTVSPVIHNTLAEKEDRNMVYVPFRVENGNLKAAVDGAYALNLLGLNVTVPYKSDILCCLREVDETAEKIGAVNTLVRTENGFKGYNTDMPGLYRAMCSEHIKIAGEDILLLGAGGAARAVAFLCALKGADKIYMLNRTIGKAQAVAAEINGSVGKDIVIPLRNEAYKDIPAGKKYLAIQATSAGLFPNTEEVVIDEEDFYARIHTGYDLIYKPSETKFMKLVKNAGGKAFHGLKMLLYQGIIAYELWNDVSVTEEAARDVYDKMKKAMGIEE